MSAIAGTPMWILSSSLQKPTHTKERWRAEDTFSKICTEVNHTLCRTLFCWVTSTQAAIMWQALSGSRFVSSQIRVSTGWYPMMLTPQCHTLTALMTGTNKHTPALGCTHKHWLLITSLILHLQDCGHYWHDEGSRSKQCWGLQLHDGPKSQPWPGKTALTLIFYNTIYFKLCWVQHYSLWVRLLKKVFYFNL